MPRPCDARCGYGWRPEASRWRTWSPSWIGRPSFRRRADDMPVLPTHGARVSYTRTGTGPPVLLIQGVGAIGDAWRPQINGLRDRFSLIAFDHRGLGASTMTEGTL